MIIYRENKQSKRDETIARLRGLAGELSFYDMRKIVERDATLVSVA